MTAVRKWAHCVKKINHSCDSWLVLRSLQLAFHVCSAILETFFYVYRAIVDGFVVVSVFLEKHYIPQYYRSLICYICVRLCQWFSQGGCFFRCDKTCACNYTCTQRFLLIRSCAYRDAGTGVHYGSIAPFALWKGGQRGHTCPYITVS